MNRILFLLLTLAATTSLLNAQNIVIEGTVRDALSGQPLSFVTVYLEGSQISDETDKKGRFEIVTPRFEKETLIASRVGYKAFSIALRGDKLDETSIFKIELESATSDLEVEVTDKRLDDGSIHEDVKALEKIPTATGNIESILPHIGLGVNTGTGGELSSQYNVRGGNFDENLVYVNGFEIYRPQLIRSSQQEGLTFANPDLIGNLKFSSGGFESKYGDKMSSVLDIKYKTPERVGGSIEGSILGASGHFEGSFLRNDQGLDRLKVLLGVRYRTTRYLLGTLDIDGEYIPNFTDVQSYITYDFNDEWQLGLLMNYNRSEYQFAPESRSTAFGLVNFALQLNSVYQGQEVDDFTTAMGGLSLTWLPKREKNPLFMKLLISGFRSLENERRDVLGFYRLGESSRTITGEGGDELASLLGTGTQHNFVRNYLTIDVVNAAWRGGYEKQINNSRSNTLFYEWGLKWQHEEITDQLNEWERLDSAGYSLNYDDESVQLLNVIKSDINLSSDRFLGYAQATYSKSTERAEKKFIGGLRTAYWSLNEEVIVSPRFKFLYKPLQSKRDISYRLSAGYYFQPPFYRELRSPQGIVNPSALAQKSLHLVGGMTYDFKWGNHQKDFRFITEIYYKRLWDLISYDVDNVRIRYSGQNDATGYVMGADFRVNGEFVPGAESWFNISILSARENLNDVQHLAGKLEIQWLPMSIMFPGHPIKPLPLPYSSRITCLRMKTSRHTSISLWVQDCLSA